MSDVLCKPYTQTLPLRPNTCNQNSLYFRDLWCLFALMDGVWTYQSIPKNEHQDAKMFILNVQVKIGVFETLNTKIYPFEMASNVVLVQFCYNIFETFS